MKVSTGIEGLDRMLKGGLIPNKTYLISGGPGSGKTTLATHFLIEGARNGENVMYVTLEESAEEIKEEMKLLGFDFDNYSVKFIDSSPTGENTLFGDMFFIDLVPDIRGFKDALEEKIKESKPSRIVIDPLTMLELASKSEIIYRRDLLYLIRALRELKITTLITTEKRNGCPEEYVVSGIVELLEFEIEGKIIRGIRVKKMRGSDFDDTIRPYRLTSRGIEVYPEAKIFE
jgi:KaiC/GvpD/RAD55 family RecA-like ATPase